PTEGSPNGNITAKYPINKDININIQICVHGSSQISIPDGTTKDIQDLRDEDTIVDASGQSISVKNVIQCWLGPKIEDKYQPVLVFEKDSLGPNLPSSRLAIDPKHP